MVAKEAQWLPRIIFYKCIFLGSQWNSHITASNPAPPKVTPKSAIITFSTFFNRIFDGHDYLV